MLNKTMMAATMLAAFGGAQAQMLSAGHDYVVEDTGTYSADSTYMNYGLAAGRYKGMAALDFNAASLGAVASVNSATLVVQESDYTATSSVPVNLTVYAVTDNVSSLAAGQSAIIYNDSVLGGLTTQLGTATQLGTFVFNPTSLVNGGLSSQNDVINLTTGLSAIASLINSSNNTIRLVVTTNETGEVTDAGAGSSSAYVPTLTLQVTPAPEPASMAALGFGVAALLARRRRKGRGTSSPA
ncbi:MAG: PEP-CTERM sorting domain-containing protein [Fimbriimonadaceae bacterium]